MKTVALLTIILHISILMSLNNQKENLSSLLDTVYIDTPDHDNINFESSILTKQQLIIFKNYEHHAQQISEPSDKSSSSSKPQQKNKKK